MDGKDLKWLARVEGELEAFGELLRLDMPFDWGRTVGGNVLEFESLSYHPLRRTFYWKLPNKQADKHAWVATLEVSQYAAGKLSVVFDRRMPIDALMTARPMNAQEFSEWRQQPQNEKRGWAITSAGGETCFIGWPWSEETERIVVYGRKVISWLRNWLSDSYGAVVECTWPRDVLFLIEHDELKSPTGLYLTEEARHMKRAEAQRATSPIPDQSTQRALEFTINATEQGFADWLNGYGKAAQGPDFIARAVAWDTRADCGLAWGYGITHPLSGRESIFFEVQTLAADRTRLVMRICSTAGQPSQKSLQYYATLAAAIRTHFADSNEAKDTQRMEESSPREADQIKTTAAHFGWQQRGLTQTVAAQLMGTTDKTYRKYRDSKWLLSEDEFRRITGQTVADYWEVSGGS